ncbi:hypothetical protein ACWZJV_27335 [Nocardioides sp. WG-D5]
MSIPSHPTRRTVLIGAAGAGLASMTPATAMGASAGVSSAVAATMPAHRGARDLVAYVGSRTTRQRNARGAGITVWRVPATGRSWELLQTVVADDNDPNTPTPEDALRSMVRRLRLIPMASRNSSVRTPSG